jgi:hypothetical protein
MPASVLMACSLPWNLNGRRALLRGILRGPTNDGRSSHIFFALGVPPFRSCGQPTGPPNQLPPRTIYGDVFKVIEGLADIPCGALVACLGSGSNRSKQHRSPNAEVVDSVEVRSHLPFSRSGTLPLTWRLTRTRPPARAPGRRGLPKWAPYCSGASAMADATSSGDDTTNSAALGPTAAPNARRSRPCPCRSSLGLSLAPSGGRWRPGLGDRASLHERNQPLGFT